jgi:hypothetical protein
MRELVLACRWNMECRWNMVRRHSLMGKRSLINGPELMCKVGMYDLV